MKEKMKKYLANIMAKRRKQEGFTLIEMVVVIAHYRDFDFANCA